MNITSPAFTDNGLIPKKYSREGGDASPPLQFSDVPSNAKSLALICHDPDAPRENGFTHWVVWNIPPTATGFAENAVPSGAVQGTADFGGPGWGGPKPPSGTHRYIFYLYALDTALDLPVSTMRPQLQQAMQGHIVAEAVLTGLYSAE